MINLWYEESYWAHAGGRVSGPEKVVRSTIEALTQEGIDFSVNEDKYSYNFLLQYQHEVAHKKHESLEHDSCVIGPQFWPFDSYGEFLDFLTQTEGTKAESNCNSPSIFMEGSNVLSIAVASATILTLLCRALLRVENESIATFGSPPIKIL